jgi:hypothetical protein
MRNLALAAALFLFAAPSWAAISTATASGDQTLSSTTDAAVDSMTITPGAGDYLAIFTMEIDVAHTTTTNVQIIVSIFVNGVEQSATERYTSFDTSEDTAAVLQHLSVTHRRVTPTAGQAVAVNYRKVGTESPIAKNRTLILIPYAASNFSQVVDEVDDTIASSTETQLDTMTITPGSGTYLAVFSTSFETNTAADTAAFMLYVNGAKLTHTDRSMTFESSFTTGSEFSVLIAAKVEPGAGAVAAYWARPTGTGTLTSHHRILTLIKMDSATDLVESNATDNVTSTSTTYEAFSTDITATPGVGPWLGIYSGTQFIGTVGNGNDQGIQYALFTNGVAEAESEMMQSQEESIDSTDMPVWTIASVAPTAGQVVNMRWLDVVESSALTRTERERTMVLVRESTGGAACTPSLMLLGVGRCG